MNAMVRMIRARAIVCAASLLLGGAVLFGQAVNTAQISGVVEDPTGGVIASAKVRATQLDTGLVKTAETGAAGTYVLPNLPVGPYRLEVSAQGFRNYVQTGIVLQVGDNVKINVSLQIGQVTQSVEVSANATMVATESPAISQVIDQQRIVDLPLNGRDATQLILLSGASTTAPGGDLRGSKNFYSSTTIAVAGGQGNGTNYLLDGGSNVDTFSNVNLPFPFPDAIQEFSVDTSALPAKFGAHPGATVNVVTKSGTNRIHGDVFEFIRNGAVNARNFFAAKPDTLRRNQFGGTIGGPIRRDKLFFFAGYQGTRTRSTPPTTTAHVPTAAALSGDWSTLESAQCVSKGARTITNPQTGLPFAGAQVDPTLYSPAALALMQLLPPTSDPCGLVRYGIANPNDDDQEIGRIDYNISDKQQIFGRYFIDDYRAPAPWDPANLLVTTSPGNLERAQTFSLGHTYNVTLAMVNSFHLTWTRRRDNRGPNPQMINVNKLGVNMFTYVPDDMRLQINNAFNVGCGTCSPGFFNVNTGQISDDVNFVRGKHQIAFGTDLAFTQNNTLSGYLQNGNFNWNGQYSGDSMLDFLLGDMNSFSQSRSQQVALRQFIPGVYVQDTYRMRKDLTLSAGLRWEPMLFPSDVFHRGSIFDESAFLAGKGSSVYTNAPAGSFFFGDPGVNSTFTHNKMNIFAPRLGLAWNPGGSGKQSIRVGGALLYDSGMVWFSQRLMSNPPVVNEIDLTSGTCVKAPCNSLQSGPFDNPWAVYASGNPFPGAFPPPSDVTFPTSAFYAVLPPHIKPTYMSQWNVSYQRQFSNDWMTSISYLGNKTTHVWLTQDQNTSVYIPGSDCGSTPVHGTGTKACSTTGNTGLRRQLYLANPAQGQFYGSIDMADDGGNANYNALLLSVQHRLSQNYTILANYTYSHCLSEGDFNGDLRGSYYQDPFNRALDYGDCNYDITHIVNISAVLRSPRLGSGWVRRLTEDWQFSPIISYNNGTAINVTSGKDNSLTAEGQDRPNRVAGVSFYEASRTACTNKANCFQYLNPAAFTSNPTGTFGDLARDSVRSPGQFNFDAALLRTISMNERWKVDLRFEAFNVINHTNLSGPSTNLSSSSFGQITGAGDPRILQGALKVHF